MNDMQSLLSLLKCQGKPVNLNQICACISVVPRDNVKEMLEWMHERGLVKISGAASPLFPRQFEAA